MDALTQDPITDLGDWMVDIEITLVKAFNWSLKDIDDTDIESLLPFLMKLSGVSGTAQSVYCDQVDWM
ncbi:MAG: hypothetical protein PHQ40_00365 [Anaerolineaceae bacterium]|nr:hypothetical protein [Anaerolineaceae bacterium]MDD5367509.1 hypothetical protein [Anaerolineaceae bacterium]